IDNLPKSKCDFYYSLFINTISLLLLSVNLATKAQKSFVKPYISSKYINYATTFLWSDIKPKKKILLSAADPVIL
ncbi:MAG: hypothetical protein IKG71_07215, partial [Firmicutes bacterium]|nr:hypothetical protein [Bacillota bacterium]